VIVEADDIFGDGVNVAARLEGLAEPGGVCVSRTVRNQVRDKLPYEFEDIGEQQVKNIARPVRADALSPAAIAALPAVTVIEIAEAAQSPLAMPAQRTHHRVAAAAIAALLLIIAGAGGWWVWLGRGKSVSEPPSLSMVVLPFENLSKDPDQDYFVDGVTDDLTTDLSRIAGSFVISRTTAFTYKGAAVDVRQIGRDLGVRYVLEGSVRRTDDRVHLNVQLIDAASGAHVRADQFDFDRANLVETQSELTGRIANALRATLVRDAARRIEEAKASDPSAEDLVMQGWAWRYKGTTKETLQRAREAFEEALQIDPRSLDAKVALAATLAATDDLTASPLNDAGKIETLLQDVIARDPDLSQPHHLLGNLRISQKRLAEAKAEFETAAQLDPNNAGALRGHGVSLLFLGQPAAALADIEKSLRLNPRDPFIEADHRALGLAHLYLRHYAAAAEFLTRARNENPHIAYTYFMLAAALAMSGDLDAGKSALAEGQKLAPKVASLAVARDMGPCSATSACAENREKTYFAGLRKLGFPEK